MVLKWIEQYRSASRDTKVFIWNAVLYAVLLIGSTVYCYARIEFVRTYKLEPPTYQSDNAARQP